MVCGLVLVGCGTDAVQVEQHSVAASERSSCAAFLEALPDRVADRSRREVSGSTFAAAWGDPPIVLRCGVGTPEGLTKLSACQRANGIDWFVPDRVIADQDADVLMTTIGRAPAVEVVVPAEYRPPVEAMVDLAPTIKDHTERVGRCR